MKQTTRVLLVAGGLVLAMVQGAAAQDQGWTGRGIAAWGNYGTQTGSHEFTEGGTVALYDETATFTGKHKISSGPMFDVGGAVRVWQNWAVGATVSYFDDATLVTLDASVPHPLFFNRPRTASVSCGCLSHTETAIHLQAIWVLPLQLMDKLRLSVSAGPTIFKVTQEMVESIPFSEVGAPYTSVNTGTAVTVEQRKSKVGFNVGADLSYTVWRMFGVGGFARYSKASVSLPAATAGGDAVKLDLGGFQLGGGLRLTF